MFFTQLTQWRPRQQQQQPSQKTEAAPTPPTSSKLFAPDGSPRQVAFLDTNAWNKLQQVIKHYDADKNPVHLSNLEDGWKIKIQPFGIVKGTHHSYQVEIQQEGNETPGGTFFISRKGGVITLSLKPSGKPGKAPTVEDGQNLLMQWLYSNANPIH